MEYGAIDLHKKESQIRIVTKTGEILDQRIATTRDRFTFVFWGRPRMRILVEASTESEWVAQHLDQWLFLHSLDSVATVRRLVAFYVDEHNRVLPHSAFRGQTPDEMYFGTGDAVPPDLRARAAAARRARVEANRSASCQTCPSLNAAA